MPATRPIAAPALRAGASRRPGLLERLRLLLALHAQRRALARADAHLLDDIGIDRDAALAEANRPVWDVPRSGCAEREASSGFRGEVLENRVCSSDIPRTGRLGQQGRSRGQHRRLPNG